MTRIRLINLKVRVERRARESSAAPQIWIGRSPTARFSDIRRRELDRRSEAGVSQRKQKHRAKFARRFCKPRGRAISKLEKMLPVRNPFTNFCARAHFRKSLRAN